LGYFNKKEEEAVTKCQYLMAGTRNFSSDSEDVKSSIVVPSKRRGVLSASLITSHSLLAVRALTWIKTAVYIILFR